MQDEGKNDLRITIGFFQGEIFRLCAGWLREQGGEIPAAVEGRGGGGGRWEQTKTASEEKAFCTVTEPH